MIRMKLFAISMLIILDLKFYQRKLDIKEMDKENKENDINNIVDNDNPNNIIDNDNFNNDFINNDYINNDYINNNYMIKKLHKIKDKNDKYNIIINNTKIKKIPVSFAVDNNYIYPLIVLLTSILYNSSPKTIYSFHFLISEDFLDVNKKKIINLTKKYPYPKCELKFHNLEDNYIDWTVYGNYTQTVYYRLSLSDIGF